jgi:hypothetical protein
MDVPRPEPFCTVPIVGQPGRTEVEAYMKEWKAVAEHEQAILEGKCVDGDGGLAPDINPADSLTYWTREYAAQRRRGAVGRLQFVGMRVSAKPIANADAESGFSRLKQISDPHRQNMKTETLQYLFTASENADIADPALRILIRRWLQARHDRASSMFAPPLLEAGRQPAE